MNKYGKIALLAITYCKNGYSPVESWEKASFEIFGDSTSAVKSCPKSTFLSLCEEGFIKEVSSGDFTKSIKNKMYALKALDYLNSSTDEPLNLTAVKLWRNIHEVKKIKHNSQMDVVLALWNNNLINKE